MLDRGEVHIVVTGYIFDHYCFMFDKGVVHIVVAVILVPITLCGLTYCCDRLYVDHYYLMFHKGVVHIVVTGYIFEHYCFMFDKGVVHIVVAVILVPITLCGLTKE